ncbi:DUF2935 domain-containing protein [Thermoflavimicrobium daqui]|jgi:hypothetical protein|uniref:DUF2935 domain-containing protein n=1 Tax=Thermoflavimicrobium daqui TaxID=2137476 RepID=A0A364K905_9BACL|nr:DUF2935 domain-containing protein [Thermoflavimicrobium daqui]RAL26777.1 hypothetical protein DL897_01610 [Thermoflavimicrobium daqui]
MDSFQEVVHFEQSFWLQIMYDHTRFILDALSPKEKEEIKRAKALKKCFSELEQSPLDTSQLKSSYQSVNELIKFKLHILRRLLTNSISFNLTPTFVNHMINEAEEYLRILSCLVEGKAPQPLHPLHQHLLWLPDAAGHAEGIDEKLDGTEKTLKAKCRYFIHHFEDFYIKAVELSGYLRTRLKNFPALSRFYKDVELEITLFMNFLKELEEMGLNKEILGTMAPLMADHMYREERYYLTKLAEAKVHE